MPDSGPEVGAGSQAAAPGVPPTKAEYKQISTYAGAALIGAATWIATPSNAQIVEAFIPTQYKPIAASIIAAIGGALVLYREKHKPSTGVSK